MASDPGQSRWAMPDANAVAAGVEAVAIGADLAPATLLAGYRAGLFPMPHGQALVWLSPDPRAVLPLQRFHPSRSLRRSSRAFTLSIDQRFEDVLAKCARPGRSGGVWITTAYRDSYQQLFDLGWAHSIEVLRDGQLVGGLFGVELGGLFCGESMFHTATDASKAAVWACVAALCRGGGERLFDVQWQTDHLASLGVVEIPRSEYLARLPGALALPAALQPTAPRPLLEFVGPTAAR